MKRMIGLPKAIVTVVLTALILGNACNGEVRMITVEMQPLSPSDIWNMLCVNNPMASYFSYCQTTPADIGSTTTSSAMKTGSTTKLTTTASTTVTTTTVVTSSSSRNTDTTTPSPSALERAHFCHFSNGTFVPLYYSFMQTPCTLCQCRENRTIMCVTFKCMTAYCIDGSKPVLRDGQCCPQCAYDASSTPCTINNYVYPQGAIVTSSASSLQCWCQQGSAECRLPTNTTTTVWESLSNDTAIYVAVIVVILVLLLGLLVCCGFTVLYYYYYRTNQEAAQQAYEQYWNSAGWQPMGEEGLAADGSAEQKKAEAENNEQTFGYPTGFSDAYVPPPYALYNGAYTAEENANEQRHV